MTKDRAIALLGRYRQEETVVPSKRLFGWNGSYEFNYNVYARYLVTDLQKRIRESDDDPIEVVRRVYHTLDDILCESESRITWAFASTMENIAGDILRFLRSEGD